MTKKISDKLKEPAEDSNEVSKDEVSSVEDEEARTSRPKSNSNEATWGWINNMLKETKAHMKAAATKQMTNPQSTLATPLKLAPKVISKSKSKLYPFTAMARANV